MAWSVSDLSGITQLLITQLGAAVKASPRYLAQNFPFDVNGLMPAVSRTEGTNVLSLYLLHVGRDPYWRNTPVSGPRAQLNAAQPLSLNLSYLLTSYSEKNWQMEQYLMSVAFAWFHANPIYVSSSAEFTVTVEADSIEEMSRLWQAITAPIRLSAMFRVAVVFLSPATDPAPLIRTPDEFSLSVEADLNSATPTPSPTPRLFAIALHSVFRVEPNATLPVQLSEVPGQPAIAAGESLWIRGSALDTADAATVYLSPIAGGAEWIVPRPTPSDPIPPMPPDPVKLLVILPNVYGLAPATGTTLAVTPPPGKYQLTVGSAGAGFRSNALALAIAPAFTGMLNANPAVLKADATGTYSFTAAGLVEGATAILLDQTSLTVAAAVAPGAVTVNASSGAMAFQLPGGVVTGSSMQVRLVVNEIEAAPGWWVTIP